MLILMKADATPQDLRTVEARVRELGFVPNLIPGATRTAIGITGNEGPLDAQLFANLSGVAEAVAVSRPWKLVSREVKPDDSFVRLPGADGAPAQIGGGHFGVIAGPCAVESREQIHATAVAVKREGHRKRRSRAHRSRELEWRPMARRVKVGDRLTDRG